MLARCRAAERKLKKAGALKSFAHYNSALPGFGLPVPVQRAIFRQGYSFNSQDHATRLRIWDHIWHEGQFIEVMSQALLAYERKTPDKEILAAWPALRGWSSRIDNWAHSDSLSSVYARLLELDPGRIYPVLAKWNQSSNPWLRRQSVVSLLYYSSARTSLLPVSKLLPLVKNLLHDEDYYVQKGVGWALREISNVYPREARSFLLKHVRNLAPAAFSSATEKYAPKDKAQLKSLRKRA